MWRRACAMPRPTGPGHFDLIFANILAGPLRRLAPSIARVLSSDGTLILSGLLEMDVAGVLAAYRHQGLASRANHCAKAGRRWS